MHCSHHMYPTLLLPLLFNSSFQIVPPPAPLLLIILIMRYRSACFVLFIIIKILYKKRSVVSENIYKESPSSKQGERVREKEEENTADG